MAAQC
jgi:hypothetical protein